MTDDTSAFEGLHSKYEVLKDGAQQDGVFVLKPESDDAALEALKTYAEETDNNHLAADLADWIVEIQGGGMDV